MRYKPSASVVCLWDTGRQSGGLGFSHQRQSWHSGLCPQHHRHTVSTLLDSAQFLESFMTARYHCPQSIVLNKLTVTQLDKKCPAFYGTRRIIAMFTTSYHRTLSWSINYAAKELMVSSYLFHGLPNGNIPRWFPTKILFFPCLHERSHMCIPLKALIF